MSLRRILYIFLLTFVCSQTLLAQSSMTDSEIMSFIVKENDKGTSREDIISKLLERGVSIERIQQLRKKYEKEGKNGQPGARDLSGVSETKKRLRQNNGEVKKTVKSGHYNRKPQTRKTYKDELTPHQRKLLKESEEESMSEEMGWLLPDSLAMYEEVFGVSEGEEEEKLIFGRNIFNREYLNFEPEMNIATPEDYQIGPGDEIYIDIWGASQKTLSAMVTPEGDIEVEGIGPMHVSGLTVEQANRRARSVLGERYADSQIKLTIGQTRAISVNVMGEVMVPGTYTLSAFSTVFHALYMAGGTNEIGTLRDIKVYRNGKLISSVDIYEYILNGNLKGNVRLASGDVVIVGPYECLVNITGKVKRPMFYEMRENESVGTLLDYAGGFSGDAYQGNVRLIRKKGEMYSVHSINEFDFNSFKLCDGDSVAVDSVLDRYRNMVEVKGAVFRPGMYQMDGTVTTVRQVLTTAGGLTEDAFAYRGIIHRRKEDRTLEVISFNTQDLLTHKVPDIALKTEDVIFIPSEKEIKEERILKISGEVLYPGEYEYAENTTIEDFILQAGGLKDAASIVKVDVSRRIRNNQSHISQTEVARTYTMEIKNGFVVDGEPGFKLEPFDEVYVRRSPAYVEQQHVTIDGEVAFAGDYVLTQKNSRLSDLIKAAGGLNAEAYSQGARLERKLTEAEKLKQEAMVKAITSGDTVNLKKLNLGDTRYIGINLDKAIENPGNDQWDIVLRDGDKLIIPQFDNTVSINGEVMYPNTVAFKKGAKLKYYINQAGGYSLNSKKSRVFAIHMNGTVTRVKSSKDIQPGCEIVVPAKPKRKGISFAEIMSLGTMTATLGTVIATLLK